MRWEEFHSQLLLDPTGGGMRDVFGAKKTVWAVKLSWGGKSKEGFQGSKDPWVEGIRAWVCAQKTPIQIQPVSVISLTLCSTAPRFVHRFLRLFIEEAQVLLSEKIKGVDLPGLLPPVIIQNEVPSIRGRVEVLSQYAREQSADLIMVGTQDRKGVQRLLFGNFAELLLIHSTVPVCVVHLPSGRVSGESEHSVTNDVGFSRSA